MNIKFKRLHPAARLPTYGSPDAACFDLYAVEPIEVGAFSSAVARTGIASEIPPGHAMLIYSRSGHGFKHGVRLANAVGVIDSDYRGEVAVALRNDTGIPFDFDPGARLAQALVMPTERVEFIEVDSLSDTQRGDSGFGSTGQ